MLIIIDENNDIRKKLCDLLKKERIIPVDSVTDALEKICHFRSEINGLIVNVNSLLEIYERQTIRKVCNKLYIDEPPIIGYYMPAQVKQKEDLVARGAVYPLLECDESDLNFPDRYIAEIIKIYPELNFDIEKAHYYWAKTPERGAAEFIDMRKWLEEEGFIDVIELTKKEDNKSPILENTIQAIKSMLETQTAGDVSKVDYKQLYLDTMKQYDQLKNYVKELIEMIK
jgi:hypothetical protein